MAGADLELVIYRRYSDRAQRPPWQSVWLLRGKYLANAFICGRDREDVVLQAAQSLGRYGVDPSCLKVDESWWQRQQ